MTVGSKWMTIVSIGSLLCALILLASAILYLIKVVGVTRKNYNRDLEKCTNVNVTFPGNANHSEYNKCKYFNNLLATACIGIIFSCLQFIVILPLTFCLRKHWMNWIGMHIFIVICCIVETCLLVINHLNQKSHLPLVQIGSASSFVKFFLFSIITDWAYATIGSVIIALCLTKSLNQEPIKPSKNFIEHTENPVPTLSPVIDSEPEPQEAQVQAKPKTSLLSSTQSQPKLQHSKKKHSKKTELKEHYDFSSVNQS